MQHIHNNTAHRLLEMKDRGCRGRVGIATYSANLAWHYICNMHLLRLLAAAKWCNASRLMVVFSSAHRRLECGLPNP